MRNEPGPTGRKEFRMKRVSNRKRHRPEEIVSKLREADEAIARGQTSEDVAKKLGVSLATSQRWRTDLAVKTLYDLRSRVVHGTEVRLTDVDVHVARTVAVGALLQAIAFRQQFVRLHRNKASNPTDEMFRELEHCKIRGESPTGALSWPSVRRILMTREQSS